MNATLEQTVDAKPKWTAIERTFTSFDGIELYYRVWSRHDVFNRAITPGQSFSAAPDRTPGTPERATLLPPSSKRAIVLFHRGHEHSGRWHDFVEALDMPDAAIFAWDARGHGKSPGERGWAPDLATVIKDADA